MPFRLGPWEIGLILLIVLVIFGAGRLAQIGSGIGKSIRDFRRETRSESEEDEKAVVTPKKKQLPLHTRST